MDIWVGGGGDGYHDDVDDYERGNVLLFLGWIFSSVYFKLMNKASIKTCVGLGVWSFSSIREAIQELYLRNLPHG